MDQPSRHPASPEGAIRSEARYRAFLRSRWVSRARQLGLYAYFGSPAFLLADVLAARAGATRASVAELAMLRLPWMVIPVVAWVVLGAAPAWRRVPAMAVALSLLWTWGNAWAYFAAGLEGTAIQAIALLLCFITAATFLPLRLRGRAGVFAAMAVGQLALDLAWPARGPLLLRLVGDASMFAVALALVAVFETFAESQRRGLELRHHLERTVVALEASRARAEAAAREVGRLAAQVAHDVNNPLSAVKVNVRWLAEAAGQAGAADGPSEVERAEAAADALAAVDRIAGIVTDLKRQARRHDPDGEAKGGPGPRPA